jgi:glycosyltransferase involved in cell wall biosynthesis
VLQSLACGTPVVTTGKLGATPEWVKHGLNGVLTRFRPEDYMVYDLEMVRAILVTLDNPKMHRALTRAAARTKILTWEEVGLHWHKMLTRLS